MKTRTWLEQYNVTPEQIRLEVTESAASVNPQIVEKNIRGLNRLTTIRLKPFG